MGTPEFAETILGSLIDNQYPIISVYTQPDKKVGRNQELQKSPVKILAEKNNLTVFQPTKLKEEIENIKNQNPDLIIVAAYGKIIPQEILDIPRFQCINVHPSLLPKYRGASPLQNTLLNGEKETATTIMLMSAEVDAGDILAQEKTEVFPEEKLPEFSERMGELSAKSLIKMLPEWIEGEITPQKQDSSQSTFCQMLKKEDGQINWNDSAEAIFNRYRAFFPWPGIFTFWEGKRIKLTEIYWAKDNLERNKPGKVFVSDGKILVHAGKGLIELKIIQPEGKNDMPAKSFTNGYPQFLKSMLE